jgi:nucleotide-binding universal stress UspA family protein
MSAIRLILAASDFSVSAATAVDRAALLASEHAAGLELVHVVAVQSLTDFRQMYRDTVYTEQQILEHAKRRLDTLARDLKSVASSAPECLVRVGNVVDEILAAADHADLLVLGAHGSRSLRDLLIGTTAERLLRKSRRPMLVAKLEASSAYRRVMVPVDFSVHSVAALRFARQLAPGADLLIFHAYDQPYASDLYPANLPDQAIEQYHTERRTQALSNMENLRDKIAAPQARTTFSVECGDAKTHIAAKAAESGSDLIVVGKHGRSFAGELFLGGVTRHTVARAQCDVAVVPEYSRP